MAFFGDGETIQLRTLAKRMGLPTNEVRLRLRKVGVVEPLGGGTMRTDSKLNIATVEKALNINATDPQAEAPAVPQSEPDLSTLATDAKKAEATIPAPAPAPVLRGDESEPVAQGILTGESDDFVGFPRISDPDKDKWYRWVSTNSARQTVMIQRGWRFVVNEDHIRRIRPDGLFMRLRNGSGRVQHVDTELAFLPRSLWEARRKRREAEYVDRMAATSEAVQANLEEAQRTLRAQLGPGGEKHIGYIEMDAEEADERKAFSKKRKMGA